MTTTPRITVLVGFAEAGSAPEVVWSLVDAGYHVVAFARRGRASALRHSHHVVCHDVTPPEMDLQATLAEIQELVASLDQAIDQSSPRALFPLDDTAVWLCSRVRLNENWLLAGPAAANADLALNKYRQTELARKVGFNVPATTVVTSAAQLRRFVETQGFSVILKPNDCVPVAHGRMVACRKWICAGPAELDRAIAEWGERVPLVAQPFITGTGEGVFGLATDAGVTAWSAHRRVRMMNPQGSGSSACTSQAVPQEVRTLVENLVTTVSWRGMFMVELLRDAAGTLWFVELNGRPWGSMALSRRQGFEYPAWHMNLAIHPTTAPGIASTGSPGLLCRHLGREFMHLLFVLRGPKSRALSAWPSPWRALSDVMRIGWRDSFYNWRRDDPKVFIADCYYTVHDHVFKPSR